MSRRGITYQDVLEAVAAIEQQGMTPTIENVREFLGTGSNSTISNYLKLWRNGVNPNTVVRLNSTPTPDIVKAAVDRVWQDMSAKANSEIEAIKNETQTLIEAAEGRAQSAERQFNDLRSAHDELQESYRAQSAEKELLLLDLKKLREEHTLVQERYNAIEQRYSEMQTLTSRHLQDLSNVHKNELIRLEANCKTQAEDHAKLVDTIKDQNEKERHNQIVAIDNLKIENKKLNEIVLKLQSQLQEKMIDSVKLEADVKSVLAEKDQILNRLYEQEKQWSCFNDKSLISNEVMEKIYDTPKLDTWVNKVHTIFLSSIDNKFLEIKDWLHESKIEEKVEPQNE